MECGVDIGGEAREQCELLHRGAPDTR
jgi:hypothetical protein